MKYLLPFLFLMSFACQAQIKIGDITISDSLAKEYFLDCYQYPETTYTGWLQHPIYLEEVIGSLDTLDYWGIHTNRIIERYPNKTVKLRADTILPEYKTYPRTPSASDFAAFMRRKYKTK